MKSPGTSAPRLSLWMLPPPPDDGDEFRLGPPPLDLAYGLRAYALVRLLTAALAVVQHAVIALVTGDRGWWLVVAVATFHAIVMVPVGTALGRRAGWMTPLVDAISILVGALIIGDPVVIVFWAPMVLLSVLVFFGGRRAQAGLMITTACVLVAFGAGASGLVDAPLAPDVLRLHAVLSFLTMGVIVWAYTYTIGAAVRRKDLVLARAEAGRSEALRQADIRAAQLETLFDATPVGLSLQSIDTRFLHVNQRFCDIVGMSPEEVLEHGVVPLFDPRP